MERSHTKRIEYLRGLRAELNTYGSANIVYLDESGFEEYAFNPYAWSARGRVVSGDKRGNAKKNRTNLIMAQRGTSWLAPMLFSGSCDHRVVEQWLQEQLFQELQAPSVIVLDNAPFHRKGKLAELAAAYGHKIRFLPPYSPDFNPIEQTFGLIKRKRRQAPDGITLDDILCKRY